MKKLIFYIILASIAYLAYIAISLSLTQPVSDLNDKKFSTRHASELNIAELRHLTMISINTPLVFTNQ